MSLSRSSSPVAAADSVSLVQVAALRQAAVDYVERATGLTLDGSEESLAIVDHYLNRVRPGGVAAVKPDVLRLIAGALGVYLGELFTSRFGGHWRLVTLSDDDAQRELGALAGWRVELEAAPLLVDPIGMAASALLFDEADAEEDVEGDADATPGFTLLESARQLFTPLHTALARLSPVTSEYYYSLTGRFETLSYVVDLVTDLRHQEDARHAAASDAGRQTAAAPEPPEPQ
jgi:hypothetical protein